MDRFLSVLAMFGALGLSSEAAAHAPNIASFELIEGPEASHLDVHMSTDGMHHVMQARLPDASFQDMTLEDYEDHVLTALREGIELRYDDQPVALGEATVSLAAHQSDVSFAIPGPPAGAARLYAHIDVMREQPNQHNVLRLVTQTSHDHIVLAEKNQFRGSLALASARPNTAASASMSGRLAEAVHSLFRTSERSRSPKHQAGVAHVALACFSELHHP
ncbi:hypothetical protein ENSA5_12050 [Enhygromyxa salina]|uniref:Uncharacterized protein n=1 Tax=Enhygromyxa salina TaxID=215803 RepID=A0A2S9YFQ6_9BACT|nr:hypothetical protein [Enhygromyxa salina]PRQ03836.1 hypothetical protein ENSA5_12050 [Enhygromyxa salina]